MALTIGLTVAAGGMALADAPAGHAPAPAAKPVPESVITVPAPGTYTSLTPARILDTRTGLGRPVAAHQSLYVQVAGRGG